MRITIVQGAFFPVPPLRGGAIEKIWFALGPEFVRRGHQVTHISRTFPDLPAEEIRDGVRHIRVQGFDAPKSSLLLKFYDLLYAVRTLKVLPEADILVTNTFWLPILIRCVRKGRLYVHVARTPRGQLRFYAHAARLQTVSKANLEVMLREVPELADKCISIPNPLVKRVEDSSAPDETTQEKRLLYVGRLHPEKGIGLLLQALAHLPPETLSGWEMRIVGSAEARDGGGGAGYLKTLKEASDKMACTVTWTGPIFDPALLTDEYRKASLFIYPSLAEQGETFGLAPLEAMAEGCPALVSDLACFQEFIENGRTGFVFDHRGLEAGNRLAAKLTELLAQPELLRKIGKQAFEKSQAFRLDRIAEHYLADFCSLIMTTPPLPSPPEEAAKTFDMKSAYESPWSLEDRVLLLLWEYTWMLLCLWTPKPFNAWRLFWLRIFGAKIEGLPFVHQRARIQIPWNLTLRDRATLGDRANAYSLGPIEIGERAVVAQEAYLCTGTHDLSLSSLPLQIAKITIGADAFIGARAFILPGITVGTKAVVGAGSLVTKDVAESSVVAGNPARELGTRILQGDGWQTPVEGSRLPFDPEAG